jgi:sugar transferase EpsL
LADCGGAVRNNTSIYKAFGKRLFDLVLTLPTLIILSPILFVLAILVRFKLGAPVLFTQVRPGLHGKSLRLLKFRTMTNERDSSGQLLPDGDRLTGFGRFMRRWSLDELPQLINVLKGELSLVGPRPLLMQYVSLYTPEQIRRHEVRPGITGWAQIRGRNAISWGQKFALDVWYVDNLSLRVDLLILYRTLLIVIKREGISHGDHASMPEFLG